jgi:hypothetical protein
MLTSAVTEYFVVSSIFKLWAKVEQPRKIEKICSGIYSRKSNRLKYQPPK